VGIIHHANATVSHNECALKDYVVYGDLIMSAALFIFIFYLGRCSNRMEAVVDENVQSPSDYSIVVEDPEAEAADPDKWLKFFSEYGNVKFVTVVRANGQLLKLLRHRRVCVQMLSESYQTHTKQRCTNKILQLLGLKKGTRTDRVQLCEIMPRDNLGILTIGSSGVQYWRIEKVKCEQAVHEMMLNDPSFAVEKVFVTYESEADQRKCLRNLTVGLIDSLFDSGTAPKFEGAFSSSLVGLAANKRVAGNVLDVHEASEPSDIIWEGFDQVSRSVKLVKRFSSHVMCVLLVIASAYGIESAAEMDADYVAVFITASNILLPPVIQFAVDLEDHTRWDSKELALFVKMALVRTINTAILIFLITPYTAILTAEYQLKIERILLMDAFVSPILRVLDPIRVLKQKLIAPHALTQWYDLLLFAC
jgi:hypothetical protein